MLDNFTGTLPSLLKRTNSTPSSAERLRSNAYSDPSRRKKNNPILIGEPGLVKPQSSRLCFAHHSKKVSRTFFNKAHRHARPRRSCRRHQVPHQFEERMKAIMNELEKSRTLSCSSTKSTPSLAPAALPDPWTPPISSNRPWPAANCNASAPLRWTNTGSISKKTALWTGRFQKVMVDPPSAEDTNILENIKPKYEEFPQCELFRTIRSSLRKFSDRYISDRFLPDKGYRRAG